MSYGRAPKRKRYQKADIRRSRRGGCLFVIIGIFLLAVSAWQGWKEWMPNFEYAEPDTSIKQPIIWNGEKTVYGAVGSGDSLLIPLPAIQERMMPQAVYEAESELVILTNSKDVATVSIKGVTGTLNGKSKNWHLRAQEINGEIYVPGIVLEQLGVGKIIEYSTSGIVQIVLPGEEIQYGLTVKSDKDDK